MIPIFKYEEKDGIADLVRSKASVDYISEVKNVHINTNQLLQLQKLLESSTAQANPNQIDLYYLESVLASIGWNKNDDVFDKAETWAARRTIVDKPFNFMHNEKDIIGHITSSKGVDFEGGIIAEDVLLDKLPDQFDIVVGSVLYKSWADVAQKERIFKLIEEIQENKWCVSMECLFRHFDYAINYVENDQQINKILARSDDTSFLTKHLRIYGGSGEYSGYRVGRLLRNFTFSGKGLVDNPANPRSHITSFNDSSETSVFIAAATTTEELNISEEEKIMANEVVYTKEQYEALKAELDKTKTLAEQATQKEIDDMKSQINELNDTIAKLNNELDASKEVSKAKEDKVVALETELKETQSKLTEAENTIKEAEAKAVNAARKALLLDRVDEEKAENLIQKFANASQEMFDALVDSLPKKTEAKPKDKKEDEDEEEEKEGKDKKKADAELKTDLENAQAEEEAEMASGGTQEEETLCSKAASWFSSSVLRTVKQEQSE